MVCSARKHPLSSVSGRKRYNTLDFPTENRVPTGRFRPYWKPRSKGTSSPFTIPAVLKSVYTNRKNGVCIYTSQNTKIPTVDPPKRNDCGDFQCRTHLDGRNSCVTHRCGDAKARTLTHVLTITFRSKQCRFPVRWLQHLHYPDVRRLWQTTRDVLR